ncbi:MAG: hypothetical protein ACJ73S_17715 [Mycobacteriales bacterium]
MTEGIEPYGVQREACLLGEFDADGALRANPMPRAWYLWRIRGRLDADRFAAALRTAAEATEIWRCRLGRDGLAADPDRAPLRLVRAAAGPARVVETLAEVLYAPLDLRDDPPSSACLLAEDGGDHLLLVRADHAFCDGMTLVDFVRRAAAGYRQPAALPERPPGFLAHAEAAERDPDRPAARRYWAAAMAGPAPRPEFPGGRDKPWAECAASEAVPVVFDHGLLAAALDATGLSPSALLLAATCFVTDLWAPAPVPVLYARGGRNRPKWMAVPGPLHEAVVSVPAAGGAATVAGWARAHAAANTASPPLRGLWLSDFGGMAALRARRFVVLNLQPPLRAIDLGGGAVIGPAEPELSAALGPAGPPSAPSRNGLHLLCRWHAGQVTATVFHDPEVLPDHRPVVDAIEDFAALLVEWPELPRDGAADLLRGRWTRVPAG